MAPSPLNLNSPKAPPVSVVLTKAADIIEERGWTSGGRGWDWDTNPEGKVCLEGGILAAMRLPSEIVNKEEYKEFQACPAYLAVKEFLDYADDLWRWNDRVPSDVYTVIETLRQVAELERIKEMSPVSV